MTKRIFYIIFISLLFVNCSSNSDDDQGDYDPKDFDGIYQGIGIYIRQNFEDPTLDRTDNNHLMRLTIKRDQQGEYVEYDEQNRYFINDELKDAWTYPRTPPGETYKELEIQVRDNQVFLTIESWRKKDQFSDPYYYSKIEGLLEKVDKFYDPFN